MVRTFPKPKGLVVGSWVVSVGGGYLLATLFNDVIIYTSTRVSLDKGMISTHAKGPIRNTGMHLRRAAVKYTAGPGKRFLLGSVGRKACALHADYLGCTPIARGIDRDRGRVIVELGDAAFGVSRMIMAKAKARRGLGSDPMPMRIVSRHSLRGTGPSDFRSTLIGLIPSVSIRAATVKAALCMGKLPSGCLLMLVGNGGMTKSVSKSVSCSQVGVSTMGHVRMLGKTSSTLCNDSTVTKMVGVVASSPGSTLGMSSGAHMDSRKQVSRSIGTSTGSKGLSTRLGCGCHASSK